MGGNGFKVGKHSTIAHGIVGIGAVYFVLLLLGQLSNSFTAWAISAGLVGGVFADLVEPGGPGKWDHRGPFHSKRIYRLMAQLTVIFFVLTIAIATAGLGLQIPAVLFGFCLGYFLHMLVDKYTRLGLPNK